MTKTDYSYGVIPVMKKEKGFQFLLIHQAVGHWTFPKGHKDEGETDLEAAKRELLEEAGLADIEIVNDIEFSTHYLILGNKDGFTDKIVKFFLGFTKDENAKVSDGFAHEILEARWCSFEEAEKLFLRAEWQKLLQEANDYLLKNS